MPEGEHAALVGANGIGKSTLLADRSRGSSSPPIRRRPRRRPRRPDAAVHRLGADGRRPCGTSCSRYAEPRVAEAAGAACEGGALDARPPRRARAARVRGRARALGRGRRLRRRGPVGPLHARGVRPAATRSAPIAGSRRSPAASASGWRSRSSSARAFDVILLDEPDNTLDIDGKDGSRTRSARRPRRSCWSATTGPCSTGRATRIVTLEGRAAWTHLGRVLHVRRRARRSARPARRGASALRGGAPAAGRHGEGDEAARPRTTTAGPRRPAPPSTGSSGSRSARRRRSAPRGAGRRGCGSAGGRTGKVAFRVARARASPASCEPVRRGDLVRRARRRHRAERHREDALPAAARRRGRRPRGRVDARRPRRAGALRAAARARRRSRDLPIVRRAPCEAALDR